MNNKKLAKIADQYRDREYHSNVYAAGGGLMKHKYVSKRHMLASLDEGKLTLGQAVQKFKKATGLSTQYIKELIFFTFDDIEWHHSGRMPNGNMGITYFLNASQITYLAENFETLKEKYDNHLLKLKQEEELKKQFEEQKMEYLKNHARYVVRIPEDKVPKLFYETNREMEGKYGWFCSYGKHYKLPEYYSGWVFDNEEDYINFVKLFKNGNSI